MGGFTMARNSSDRWRPMAIVTAGSLMLSACVTTQTERIGSDDQSDTCRSYLVALDATGDYFAEDMVKGALIGAVAGGLLGIATGKDDRGKRALIGAAAGAAAGAAGGYFLHKRQQNQDKTILYQSVSDDLDRDLAKANEAALASKKLSDCRTASQRRIVTDYKAGLVDADEAKRRWRSILDQRERDLKIQAAMGQHMLDRAKEFDNASTQLGQLPWTEEQQKAFAAEQKALEARHKTELASLAQEKKKSSKAASSRKQRDTVDRQYAQLLKDTQARQKDESDRLKLRQQGQLQTATYQTLAQAVVEEGNKGAALRQQQLALDNPDQFEQALPPAETSGPASFPFPGIRVT